MMSYSFSTFLHLIKDFSPSTNLTSILQMHKFHLISGDTPKKSALISHVKPLNVHQIFAFLSTCLNKLNCFIIP
jgi:hypothetical protein